MIIDLVSKPDWNINNMLSGCRAKRWIVIFPGTLGNLKGLYDLHGTYYGLQCINTMAFVAWIDRSSMIPMYLDVNYMHCLRVRTTWNWETWIGDTLKYVSKYQCFKTESCAFISKRTFLSDWYQIFFHHLVFWFLSLASSFWINCRKWHGH